MPNIWTCKIGELDDDVLLPVGADAPMRQAVRAAYQELTGKEDIFCFSGWGGKLTPIQEEVVAPCRAAVPDVPPRRRNPMPKYRKKPVIVKAFQMTKERRWDNSEWPEWLMMAWEKGAGEGGLWTDPDFDVVPGRSSADELVLGTLEGVHRVSWDDFIIQGVQGELDVCKPDVFEATYEAVTPRVTGLANVMPGTLHRNPHV